MNKHPLPCRGMTQTRTYRVSKRVLRLVFIGFVIAGKGFFIVSYTSKGLSFPFFEYYRR